MTTTPTIETETCVICGIAVDESHHAELVTTSDPGLVTDADPGGAAKSLGRICQRCSAGRPLPRKAKYSAYVEISNDRMEARVILRITNAEGTYGLEREVEMTSELHQLLTLMDIASIKRGEECLR